MIGRATAAEGNEAPSGATTTDAKGAAEGDEDDRAVYGSGVSSTRSSGEEAAESKRSA